MENDHLEGHYDPNDWHSHSQIDEICNWSKFEPNWTGRSKVMIKLVKCAENGAGARFFPRNRNIA